MTPEIERLAKEALKYEPETGRLVWLRTVGTAVAGKEAGCIKSCGKYRNIRIGYKLMMAHQLAWFLNYGEWAGCDIDHINGNGLDNRITNLRKCTKVQNQWNSAPRARPFPKGVTPHGPGKWQARIRVNKRVIHLGTFGSVDGAELAYIQAAKRHAGEFAFVNRDAIRAKFALSGLKDAAR